MGSYVPPLPWLNIVYEDDYLLAINKPAGLLSIPGRGDTPDKTDSVMTRVLEKYPGAKNVHRLDMETSGVIVVAKSTKIEVKLRKQFTNRKAYKFYIARVWGHPDEDEGEINLPLIVDWPNRPMHKVCFAIGKQSLTRYRVLERCQDATSRMLLMPLTGRSHQLRIHLQAVGYPILGDSLYAPPEVRAMTPRMLLHAETLILSHPYFKTPFHVYCKAQF